MELLSRGARVFTLLFVFGLGSHFALEYGDGGLWKGLRAAHAVVSGAAKPPYDLTELRAVNAVLDAVRPHGLFAIDVRGISEVSVTRASRTISNEDIEAMIVRGLISRYNLGKAENLKVVFERVDEEIAIPRFVRT